MASSSIQRTLATLAFGLTACGGTAEGRHDPAAATGAGPGTGGTGTVASGATTGNDATDTGGSAGNRLGPPTDEQLATLTQPRSGTHEIWSDTCDSTLISQDYRVLPRPPRCYDLEDEAGSRTVCESSYCDGPSKCTQGERGRCEGKQVGLCGRPFSVSDPCTEDADCNLLPGGRCDSHALGSYCDFELECESLGSRCSYPESPCSTAADCPAGVECLRHITDTNCEYDTCTVDSDCEEGERCGCATCLPAECSSDSDCGEGHSCAFSMPCWSPVGFYCTTDADECVGGEHACTYHDDFWTKIFCK